MITTAPNSLTDRAQLIISPEMSPFLARGRETRKNTERNGAPRVRAARSILGETP